MSFDRLLTDARGLPYVIAKEFELHAQLSLGFPQSIGDVSFDSLLPGFFDEEKQTVTCKFTASELAQARSECSELDPPVQSQEKCRQKYRVNVLPLYLTTSPLLYDIKAGQLRRKPVNISMPKSVDLSDFLAVPDGKAVYDLVNVLVHVGSTGKPPPGRQVRGQDSRLVNAARGGHYVLYAKVNDETWYDFTISVNSCSWSAQE